VKDKKEKYDSRHAQSIHQPAFLDALDQHVLLFDGAMGTNLDRQNLTPEHFGGERTAGCNDYLVITYPQAVEKVHRAFWKQARM
jgi:methionine synthase I (cobalamin-dependent)